VIATFGRALWVLDDIRPLRKIAANKGEITKPLTAFEAPTAVQAQIRNAPGYEWSTWGIWDADNRSTGAPISYYIKPVSDTSKTKKDTVAIQIFNANNEVIRNLKWPADSGFNKRTWGMEERGYRMPGAGGGPGGGGGGGRRGGGGRGGNEPPGQPVLPGTYKVVMNYRDQKDSTMVTVIDDPRLGNRNAIKQAQAALRAELKKSGDQLIEAMDFLTKAEEDIKQVDAYINDMRGKEVDSLKRSSKKLTDEIKKIREFISGKQQTKQGYGQVPQITVMNQYQQANQSIASKPIEPGDQEKELVKRAAGLIKEAVDRVNALKDGAWKNYTEQVKSSKLDPFGGRN
jgi:archaellum component FlaC